MQYIILLFIIPRCNYATPNVHDSSNFIVPLLAKTERKRELFFYFYFKNDINRYFFEILIL